MTRRRGLTLIEVMVSMALLAVLMGMALIAFSNAAEPLARTSARSDLTVQAAGALNRVVEELEGAVYTSATQMIGDYDQATGTMTFDPTDDGETLSTDLIDNDLDGFVDEEERWGRAISFSRILAFDNAGNPVLDSPTVYAFLPEEAQNGIDDDRDGRVDELNLVRIQDGESVVLLREVRNEGAIVANGVAPSPYFHLVAPSYLELNVRMRQRVGFNQTNNVYEFTSLEFAREINLRNMNQ